jgi:ketosteroid isomerase-like protein
MDEMVDLYIDDLGSLVLTAEGEVARFSKAELMSEFQSRRDAGDAPLSTEKRVLHIEEQGDHATAILYRRMSLEADAALYELRLKKTTDGWRVAGETVIPWPDLSKAKGFLPPRKNA